MLQRHAWLRAPAGQVQEAEAAARTKTAVLQQSSQQQLAQQVSLA
jgi:hypothetical protein